MNDSDDKNKLTIRYADPERESLVDERPAAAKKRPNFITRFLLTRYARQYVGTQVSTDESKAEERDFSYYSKRACKLLHVKYWILVPVLFIYTALGAVMFMSVEPEPAPEGNSEATVPALVVGDTFDHLLEVIERHANDCVTYTEALRPKLLEIMSEIYSVDSQGKNDASEPSGGNWGFWKSAYFCYTIYTTIGYGDVSPTTDLGRVLTILYALLGIPLMLATLASLGILLEKFFKTILSAGRRVIGRTTARENIPIWFVLALFMFWFMLQSVVAWRLEPEKDFFDRMYFTFITLSTIGFGDLCPKHQHAMFLFPMILIGLAIFSMAFSVITEMLRSIRNDAQRMIADRLRKLAEGEETDDESEWQPSLGILSISPERAQGILQRLEMNSVFANNGNRRQSMFHIIGSSYLSKLPRGCQTMESHVAQSKGLESYTHILEERYFKKWKEFVIMRRNVVFA